MSFTLPQIARVLGGEVSSGQVLAPGPGHSAKDRSLAVKIGAAGNIVVHSHSNDDDMTCKAYVESKLGIVWQPDENRQAGAAHGALSRMERRALSGNARPEADDIGADVLNRRASALRIWGEAVDPRETLVETYLASRGLLIPDDATMRAIRFHPDCPFGPGGQRHPCMVAAFTSIATGEVVAIHRTALTPDGKKIDRLTLAPTAGAAIMLSPLDPERGSLAVGEGIESTIAGMAFGFAPAWAMGAAGGIAKLPVIDGVDTLVILGERDGGASAKATAECGQRWQQAGREVFSALPKLGLGTDANDAWQNGRDDAGALLVREFSSVDAPSADASGALESPIPLRWHGEADPNADRAWLVRDMLFQEGRGLMSGQWGAGKTFGALDLAASVMTGLPFAGKRVSRRGGVLFIAPEGAFEIPIRLEGIVQGKLNVAEPLPVNPKRLPICWIDECPPLVTLGAVEKLVATARAMAGRLRREFDLPLALVIVDTVAAAAGFQDENNASEAQRVMDALGAVAKATGSFVLGVDHFGKAAETGTRGSSAKEASADCVLAMLGKRDEAGTVSATRMAIRKVRGARCGYEIPYSLQVIQTGENREGEPITTCTVEWLTARDTTTPTAAKDRWAPTLRVFRHALENAIEKHGIRTWPFGAAEAEHRAAPAEKVRIAFYASYPATGDDDGKRQEAKKKAFQRAMTGAIGKGLVGSIELHGVDHLWLKSD